MLAFLEETINDILKNHKDLPNSTLVLPSKRAGSFLKKYLQQSTQTPQFAPKIISIEEFIEELSGLQIIPPEELLIKGYQAYLLTTSPADKESFSSYVSWGKTLLNDFNEIDRYLINPQQFFSYLSEIKTLEKWGIEKDQTPLITSYLAFWDGLLGVYEKLNDLLLADQRGYQGMVYRKAAEDIEHYITHKATHQHFFIGFNALNIAEQHIIQELLETGRGFIYWDVDAYFQEDPAHSASLFTRSYFKNWKYYQKNSLPVYPSNYNTHKKVRIVETPNNISQVKFVGTLISTYTQQELDKTAIVLADEALLIPMLYSLPKNVLQVNVTMGATLSSFQSTTFFELLLKLHIKESASFYHKSMVAILGHPLSQELLTDPQDIIAKISEQNSTYISLEELLEIAAAKNANVLRLLFGNWNNDSKTALKACRSLLRHMYDTSTTVSTERAVWYQLDEIFKNIDNLTLSYEYLQEVSSIHGLFQQLIPSASLDFEGDASNGLQIMGVLETRSLDFENVILLSVNEGVLPTGKSNASFITYDLKKTFNLPMHTDKDAVYTYHFYRLLHRAQQVTLVYNSHTTGLTTGEKSRYILQLEVDNLPNHNIKMEVVTASVSLPKLTLKVVDKTELLIERLAEIGSRYFSPSAMTSYIRNPIDFYYQKVLKINETEEVEETVAYNTLGTIVHEALEKLYKPFEGASLSVELLTQIKGEVPAEVQKQFGIAFRQGDYSKGKNLIIFEVIKRYVQNLINLDISEIKKGNSIKILYLETELRTKIDLPEIAFPIYIGGKVDRVDLYNDQIRIIDYKTGKVAQSDLEITGWDGLIDDYKYSKAFQVLSYALMIKNTYALGSVEAGVISFKNLKSGFLPFAVKKSSKEKNTIITEEILTQFTHQLKTLLLEICNKSIPFTEKEV